MKFIRTDWLSAIAAAALIYGVLCDFAHAACPFQTLTSTIQPANLTTTACISTVDATLLNTALASVLIAAGNPTPTAQQEWVVAGTIMTGALNTFALGFLQGQATASAVAGVTFTGAK